MREGAKEVWLLERESVASFIVMGVLERKKRRGTCFKNKDDSPMA